MKLKVWFILTVMALTSTLAFGHGPNAGGGGYVVKVGNSYRVLDLVEFGADSDPYNPVTSIHPKILKHVQQSLYGFSSEVISSVANKLSNIHAENPFLAYFLISAMKEYTWKVVGVPIARLDDIGQSNVDISKLQIYQGAVRTFDGITFNRSVISKMDSLNITALIFHEIIYAMVIPEWEYGSKNGGFSYVFKKQVNFDARKIVGAMFSQAAKYEGYAKVISESNWRAKSTFGRLYYGTDSAWLTSKGRPVTLYLNKLVSAPMTSGTRFETLKEKPADIVGLCNAVMTEEDFSNKDTGTRMVLKAIDLQPYKVHRAFVNTSYSRLNFTDHYADYPLGVVTLMPSNFLSDVQRSRFQGEHSTLRNMSTPEQCVEYIRSLQPLKDPVEALL